MASGASAGLVVEGNVTISEHEHFDRLRSAAKLMQRIQFSSNSLELHDIPRKKILEGQEHTCAVRWKLYLLITFRYHKITKGNNRTKSPMTACPAKPDVSRLNSKHSTAQSQSITRMFQWRRLSTGIV